jgi:hypothetical protein
MITSAVADRANGVGRSSRSRGAPTLSSGSSREQVTAWLQWCDPNGCHTDELAGVEGFEPYTLDSAWEQVEKMTEDV